MYVHLDLCMHTRIRERRERDKYECDTYNATIRACTLLFGDERVINVITWDYRYQRSNSIKPSIRSPDIGRMYIPGNVCIYGNGTATDKDVVSPFISLRLLSKIFAACSCTMRYFYLIQALDSECDGLARAFYSGKIVARIKDVSFVWDFLIKLKIK